MSKKKQKQQILLPVLLEKNIRKIKPFKGTNQIRLNQSDIFRLGFLTYDPPKSLKETDYFDWQQKKVPALQELYEDYISFKTATIVTDAIGETGTKVSEIIGVGVGLTYACRILNIKANRIQKIPSSPKQKTLDFKIVKGKTEYEIETRSTSYEGKVSTMMKEVLAKKSGKKGPAVRFGAVALSRNSKSTKSSYVLIGDDNDFERIAEDKLTAKQFLKFYLPILSMIMDSYYYNKTAKKLQNDTLPSNTIPIDRIPKNYEYNGKVYLGDVFDRRLILESIKEFENTNTSTEALLQDLTNVIGVHQTFIGIDLELLHLLNTADSLKIAAYEGEVFSVLEHNTKTSSIGDGVLISEYNEDAADNLRELLPKKELIARLARHAIYASGAGAPKCGAPCRSREKFGKSCAIKTYRGKCRYHR